MSLHIDRITGRRWISIGPLHLGFGPYRLLERIQWRSKLVWFNKTAAAEYRADAQRRAERRS